MSMLRLREVEGAAMEINGLPELPERLKTRAELKRELMSTIPEGEELQFLEKAERKLTESRKALQALRTERAKLMRQISIRKRKLQDWKSKIPRTSDPSHEAAAVELARLGDAQCHAVAKVENAGNGGCKLVFEKSFMRGLTGLGGFEKAWVILKSDAEEAAADGLGLLLVDLVNVDVAKGLVEVRGLEEEFDGVDVLDIKPYLAYCEAFPDDANNDEGD